MNLNDLKIGEKAVISEMLLGPGVKKKLIEMGLTCGVEVCLKQRAPLGDPLWVEVRGYGLILRKEEAQKISVIIA
ncbi:MAG: ferrous iron transport protein A [Clostridiales bacterium]|nr:ferrous iron transport protein A [Clostridiales bacterium]